ncbi:hypothetical protein V8E51_013157 [Hyaloscypha variabilis]
MATSSTHLSAKKSEPSPDDWLCIKEDIKRLYMYKEETFQETRNCIRDKTGFEASEKQWRVKLKEWGFVKNLPSPAWQFILYKETELAKEGKVTVFYYGGHEVTRERINKFKSREPREVPLLSNPSLPEHLTYDTPLLKRKRSSSSTPRTYSSLLLPFDAAEARTHRILQPPQPFVHDLDGWLFSKARPWSHIDLSDQLGDQDDAPPLYDDLPVLQKPRDLGFRFHTCDDPLDHLRLEEESYVVDRPAIKIQRPDSGDAALDDFFALAERLPQHRGQHREFTSQELKIHMELAKALAEAGRNQEAIRLCRRIEVESHEIVVHTLLGMCLAKTNRLQESMKWLFIALTGFITTFKDCSFEQNELHFDSIYNLFSELNSEPHETVVALIPFMNEMIETLEQFRFDQDVSRVCPKLFIHGFAIAYQCSILGMGDSAKCLYKYLLEQSFQNFDDNRYTHEKGIAHQTYGILLRNERNWESSADQLLLACEFVSKSCSYDRTLVLRLAEAYHRLFPHLMSKFRILSTTAESILKYLAHMRYHANKLEHTPLIGVQDYLEFDVPRTFGDISPAEMCRQFSQFTLSMRSSPGGTDSEFTVGSRDTVRVGLRVNKNSTNSGATSWSTSGDGSHDYGKTFSDYEYGGISDRVIETLR